MFPIMKQRDRKKEKEERGERGEREKERETSDLKFSVAIKC